MDTPPLPSGCEVSRFDTFDDGNLADWITWADDGTAVAEGGGDVNFTVDESQGPGTSGIQAEGWNFISGTVDVLIGQAPSPSVSGHFLWIVLVDEAANCELMVVSNGLEIGIEGAGNASFTTGWIRVQVSEDEAEVLSFVDGAWTPIIGSFETSCELRSATVSIFSGTTQGPAPEFLKVSVDDVRICVDPE